MKVSIIGSGNVGATAAFLISQRNLADVVLIDVLEGVSQGKALDMMQSSPLLGFKAIVKGSNDFKEISGSEIVVVAAGSPRKQGMSRQDLLRKNSQIVTSTIEEIVKYAPSSKIIMVTNPLDVMTQLAFKKSGFERERVLGMGGVLDTARLCYFVAQKLNVSPGKVQAMVIGSHNDLMIPLFRLSTCSGESLVKIFSSQEIKEVAERVRGGGAEIVSFLKTGSAFYAPAAAIMRMTEAILYDKEEVLSVCTYLKGEYGIEDASLSVPVKVARQGIKEIVEVDLTNEEKKALLKCAESVRGGLEILGLYRF